MVIPSHLTEAPSAELLLRANAIAKNFSGVRALRHASLELRKGEVHALIGENGAGKSTLIKIITGAITADSGTLEVAGQILPRNDPNIAHSLGISAIYQQFSLFPHLSIAENIALSLERDSSPDGELEGASCPSPGINRITRSIHGCSTIGGLPEHGRTTDRRDSKSSRRERQDPGDG
jgi:ABC-type uncharacterized transport system ATPase subunit